MKCANNNGYSMIRIKQEDVFKNRIEWKDELSRCIKSYDKVTNIFISDDNSYDNYIKHSNNSVLINPILKIKQKTKNDI
jgi:uncharacterized pyridoxamine 5'-phosphate oxidase family protein